MKRLTGEGSIVVLVLLADAREIADDLDAEATKKFCIPYTRALEDLGRAERARAEDDHLARFDNCLMDLAARHAVARRYVRDANCLVVRVEEHAGNACIAAQVEVVLNVLDTVHVGYKAYTVSGYSGGLRRTNAPVAASLRLPVSRLIYLAQISAA